jgi:RimJ/RimL family protein N-acetyltransferase
VIEVRPAPPEHYRWIAERAGLALGSGFRAIEAVERGVIVGMVGYDGWTPNSCCMHVALDKPMAARRLLPGAFATPFRLGRNVVLASVLSSNFRSRRLVRALGFKRLARIRDGWAKGTHMLLYEMRREDCRWAG